MIVMAILKNYKLGGYQVAGRTCGTGLSADIVLQVPKYLPLEIILCWGKLLNLPNN